MNRFSSFSFKVAKSFVLFISFLFALQTLAQATAVVDASFGDNGRAAINLSGSRSMVVQPDDKIIVAGDLNNNSGNVNGALLRFDQNGNPDAGFGENGRAIFSRAPLNSYFYGAAVQPDGKIVAIGNIQQYAGLSQTDFFVVRFNPNGSVDTSFGNNGMFTLNQGVNDVLRAVKIQPDGKIVAVGGTSDQAGRGAVIRLNANGTLDSSFSGGFVFIDVPVRINESFSAVEFYNDGRILVAGEVQDTFQGPGNEWTFATLLETNGRMDSQFGSGFVYAGTFEAGQRRARLITFPDNSFLLAGDWIQIRFSSNGSQLNSDVFWGLRLTAMGKLPSGHLVVSFGRTNDRIGIRVYSPNLRLVGKHETASTSTDLYGYQIAGLSNNKIVIFRFYELLRLEGMTSQGTRMADFDADRKTNISVYRPSDSTLYTITNGLFPLNAPAPTWAERRIIPENYRGGEHPSTFTAFSEFAWFNYPTATNSSAFFGIRDQITFQWGTAGDIPAGGDFDGDNYTDYTVFRPSTGQWFIHQSANSQLRVVQFGQSGDKLVPADYDYDGITDIAVFRPSNGYWFINRSTDNGLTAVQFGKNGDIPLTGDFDGEGRADFVVYRPENGTWYLQQTSAGFRAVQFGLSTDEPVPGDYDGDGRHDIAVYRNGVWYLLNSTEGFKAVHWGTAEDVPVAVRYAY